MKRIEFWIFFLLLLFPLFGCLPSHANEEEQYYQLATSLSKLSKAVEAVVAFDDPPAGTSGEELLALATAHDPSLLTPFTGYSVQAVRQGEHASVMVCTDDRDKALLEDAGCSAALDRHAWKNKPLPPCEPAVDLDKVCSLP